MGHPKCRPGFVAPGRIKARIRIEALLLHAEYRIEQVVAPFVDNRFRQTDRSGGEIAEDGAWVACERVTVDAAGFLRTVYNDWNFDLATGWHQYRNDPAVSTTVWYRSGQPRGAPWTNQWGWTDEETDRVIDAAATELDPARRKALYADFVRRANTELPLWMPIEQIFVSVINRRLRNHSNTPRWASSSWHDLWLAS